MKGNPLGKGTPLPPVTNGPMGDRFAAPQAAANPGYNLNQMMASQLAQRPPAPPAQGGPPAMPQGQPMTLGQMNLGGGMPEQSNAPVTLRSLGIEAPNMGGTGGGAPWTRPGFKPPSHSWKGEKKAPAPAKAKPARAPSRNSRYRRYDDMTEDGDAGF